MIVDRDGLAERLDGTLVVAPSELAEAFEIRGCARSARRAAVARLTAVAPRATTRPGTTCERLEPVYLRAPAWRRRPSGEGEVRWRSDRACRRRRRCGSSDVAAVHEIERLSFSTPWPAYAFEQELRGNRLARYVVARAGDARRRLRRPLADGRRGAHHHLRRPSRLAAAGHRAPAAAAPGRAVAVELGAARMTLEVRARQRRRPGAVSVASASRIAGRRPRYYSDDGEDALVMTTPALTDARPCAASSTASASAERLRRMSDAAHPGDRDQLRRDRRRGGRRRAADRGEPGGHPDRAARRDRRDRAGGGGAPAAALDRADPARPRCDEADGRLGRPRRGGGDLRAGAHRLPAGRRELRARPSRSPTTCR